MKIVRINNESTINILEETSICLGYFDGLHRGHSKLIERAKQSKYKTSLLTIELKNNLSIKRKQVITTIEDKIEILSSLKVDYLFILEFNEKIKSYSPEEFIEKILLKLNPKEVIIGQDHHFGKDAKGDYKNLEAYSNIFKTIIVNDLLYLGKKIGTRDIVYFIENGKIDVANKLLGRDYVIKGKVMKGYKVGRTYHFPTANIPLGPYVKPKNGVYATMVEIDDKKYYGMSNVGIHPTINKLSEPLIETYIFDFNDDIYEKEIKVFIKHFIRDEIMFDSIESLYSQLEKDKIKVEKFFSNKKLL